MFFALDTKAMLLVFLHGIDVCCRLNFWYFWTRDGVKDHFPPIFSTLFLSPWGPCPALLRNHWMSPLPFAFINSLIQQICIKWLLGLDTRIRAGKKQTSQFLLTGDRHLLKNVSYRWAWWCTRDLGTWDVGRSGLLGHPHLRMQLFWGKHGLHVTWLSHRLCVWGYEDLNCIAYRNGGHTKENPDRWEGGGVCHGGHWWLWWLRDRGRGRKGNSFRVHLRYKSGEQSKRLTFRSVKPVTAVHDARLEERQGVNETLVFMEEGGRKGTGPLCTSVFRITEVQLHLKCLSSWTPQPCGGIKSSSPSAAQAGLKHAL